MRTSVRADPIELPLLLKLSYRLWTVQAGIVNPPMSGQGLADKWVEKW